MVVLGMPSAKIHHVKKFVNENFQLLSVLLLVINFFGSIFIVHVIPYTEIDWETYMIQVSSVIDKHEFNYKNIEGPTGPLVYPAAHVYAYALLRWITAGGENIRQTQYIFAFTQTVALALVLRLYHETQRLPVYLIPILFFSRRILSLFVLRLFNDALQTIPLYAALLFFIRNRWFAGCVLYSLAVGVKMNALLYAPGLAVILCQAIGILRAIKYAFGVCLPVQILIAAPFLWHAPLAYIGRAFELTRKFLFKWSVNGAFLPKYIFTNSYLSIILLVIHLSTLILFAHFRWTDYSAGGLLSLVSPAAWTKRPNRRLRSTHILFVLFSSNFIGITFARTLHYQFYAWYAHTLPFLLWGGPFPAPVKLACLTAIEVVFNIYPPHPMAALVLNVAHMAIIASLFAEKQARKETIFDHYGKKIK